MQVRAQSIKGAWEVVPKQWTDPCGVFLEWYRFDRLSQEVGHSLSLSR